MATAAHHLVTPRAPRPPGEGAGWERLGQARSSKATHRLSNRKLDRPGLLFNVGSHAWQDADAGDCRRNDGLTKFLTVAGG